MSAGWHRWQYPLDAVSTAVPLATGARIANARGIPGTIGFLALTRADRQLVLVTAHHVLFGAGAWAGDPVWLLDADDRLVGPAARTLYGRAGIVPHDGADVYVDCAVAAIAPGVVAGSGRTVDRARPSPLLAIDDIVTKSGGATGTTSGVVADVARHARGVSGRRIREAPRQIVVRSRTIHSAFSAEGDSGAALRTADGAIAGLLWGTNERGESVACPIAAVLHLLQVEPLRDREHLRAPSDSPVT